MELYDKVLGSLIGAATGDAMGAATECRTVSQIKKYFGNFLTDFADAPNDTFAQGTKAGMVTDDFWQGYYILGEALKNNGIINRDVVLAGFAHWIKNPWYENFTGPTTRAAMNTLFNDSRESFQGALEAKIPQRQIINDGNSKATNGGAMKIFPAGLLNPGNIQAAIKASLEMTKVTHDNALSLSGAAAVAASIATALHDGLNKEDVLAAGLEGAKMGFDDGIGRGKEVAGPSVLKRLPLAMQIGASYSDWKEAIVELGDVIGNGLHVSEAVPAVYGILSIQCQSPLDYIYAGVNIGNDTDTIAIMVGSIIGALHGHSIFPPEYLERINRMNNVNLPQTAKEIIDIINRQP